MLDGHVRAGTQAIVDVLARQLQPAPGAPTAGAAAPPDLDHLLPGLGTPLTIRLGDDSRAVGRTLAGLNLRAVTGATVLTIFRGGSGVVATGDEPLRAGDVLALAGMQESLAAAGEILRGAAEPTAPAR